jgi:hypothetical protein
VPDAPNDDYRVVLGEECLDWRALTEPELHRTLTNLADLLQSLTDGRTVAVMDAAYETECRPDVMLADALYSSQGGLPRDERVRLQVLLSKCRQLEPDEGDSPHPVRLDGATSTVPSWGMAHALARSSAGRAMSCLVGHGTAGPAGALASESRSGWHVAERDSGAGHGRADLHLMRVQEDVIDFWRGVLTRDTPQAEFFATSERAFPQLLFAEGLRFHHFDGAYADVLPWIVRLFARLNDHFAEELSSCRGDSKRVQARFSAWDVDISPESPNTRKNASAWARRDVAHDGEVHRCDWHGKRRWDRDRVHFSRPIEHLGNRILIGIFTRHLDT